MNNEIKEILKILKKCEFGACITKHNSRVLLDYITNLREELEDLREDNFAYHQLMKMQNKREYRSKFLKEFQEEYGTNVFPDYDEIYKRYDKLKKENKILKELNVCVGCNNNPDYKSRIDKAVEKINNLIEVETRETAYDRTFGDNDYEIKKLNEIKNTLQGENKDE